MEIGAQLYTVREYTKTLEDFSETLKKIADIGYKTVQVSGTCAYSGEWLANELLKNGLRCVLTHYNPDKIRDDTQMVIAEHKLFDCQNIGIGCAPNAFQNGEEDFQRLREILIAATPAMKEAGCKIFYHNHQFEFERIPLTGPNFLERLMTEFSPEELQFTLDTYWVQYAGGDVMDWIERLKGRLICAHLKDMAIVNREVRMAVVGEGNLNFSKILPALEAAGTKYLLVEQDNCYGEDPFACLKRSYENLKKLGY